MKTVIVKQTIIFECWCPNCGHGQMEKVLSKTLDKNESFDKCVGKQFQCENCLEDLEIADLAILIPQSFDISSISGDDLRKNFTRHDYK